MSPTLTTISILILFFFQSAATHKKLDRENNGFIGPVKKVNQTWSPVSDNGYLKAGKIYQSNIEIYDPDGRLIQRSYFSGSDSKDEHKEFYKYDTDGNRIIDKSEYIKAPDSPPDPPPPMPEPGSEKKAKANPRKVFKYDSRGNLIGEFYYRVDGSPLNHTIYKYDADDRLIDSQFIIDDREQFSSQRTYKYEGRLRVPAEETIIYPKSKFNVTGTIYKSTYSEYEFNSKGDWIKRKSTSESSSLDGRSNNKASVSLYFRAIEYY